MIIFLGHERGQVVRLPDADFEREQSAGMETITRHDNQLPNQFVTAFSGEDSGFGIMQDFARERRAIGRWDIREIGYDEVELAFNTFEQIAFCKTNPLLQIEPSRIFSRERERVVGNIDRVHFGIRKMRGQRERDDTAAGADIDDG